MAHRPGCWWACPPRLSKWSGSSGAENERLWMSFSMVWTGSWVGHMGGPLSLLHDVWDLPCSDCQWAGRAPWVPHCELRLRLPRAPRTTAGGCWNRPSSKLYCPRSHRTTWGQPRDRPHLSLGQVSKIWLLLSIHHQYYSHFIDEETKAQEAKRFLSYKKQSRGRKG